MNWLGEAYFYICAAIAIAGAVSTVVAANPIRGAMGLLAMIVSIAGLFLALHAQFLAAVELIVYAGAIVVLFLFVIMLLGPSAQSPRDHRGRIVRTIGGTIFGISAVGLIILLSKAASLAPKSMPVPDQDFGGIEAIGKNLFTIDLAPFELSAALLMVAVVGAVAVARGRQPHEAIPISGAVPPMTENEERVSS